ncbi:uncharacterized protein LOC108322652 [Vigna angularis]|uniref:uncharacterized protein LOC108322652 n=1 Tax=Phaseolus angularis TaxID=3914 RepID=UPI0022B3C461|nr:uncharacterized protein LOC108322652 [Vigna angularis]
MPRGTKSENLLFDSEIERTARRNNSRRRRENRKKEARESSLSSNACFSSDQEGKKMEENGENEQRRRTLEDYASVTVPISFNSIAKPVIIAANMEMKPALIHLVQSNQFSGLSHENPYDHLTTFNEYCNTVKMLNVSEEAIRLSLFPFSLAGNAKKWLNSFPEGSLTGWDDVVSKFLQKYFPQSKINKGKQEISSFQQEPEETLSQTWDRFKGLLRKTPIHGFDVPTQLNLFLGGLKSHTKLMLDASAGGNIRWKTPDEAHEIIENMASSDNDVQSERGQNQKKGMFELQSQDALLAQNKIMTQQLESLMKKVSQLQIQNVSQAQHTVQGCELCGGEHQNGQCAIQSNAKEEVNYMGNQGRPGNYGNYNQGWRPHPSMGQASSSRPPQQQFQQQPTLSDRTSKLEETLQQFMQVSISNQKSTEASIRNLETQVSQLAKKLDETSEKKFVAKNEVHSREECNVIITRSGKEVGFDSKEKPTNKEIQVHKEEDQKKVIEEEESRNRKEDGRQKEKVLVKQLPYPKNTSQKDKERQMDRFKKIFNQLEITLPLTEALQQIPAYAKYVKQFLSKKKKYLDEETIEVQGNCSAIMQKSLPPKVKDPGSFTIPCTIGNHDIGKALVDLGASINLMPLSMLKKIGDLEVKSTKMILQMADRSIKHPYGVVEDVVITVDKLKFPVDFVVMEMEEDVKQNEEEKTSSKVKDEVLAITSLPRQVAKLAKKNLNCFNPKVKERDEDKEKQRVHQQIEVKSDELKPGIPVNLKNGLWVIKDIKANGVLEIEAPYSRRIKLVTGKLLRKCWCHERKKNTNIKNPT